MFLYDYLVFTVMKAAQSFLPKIADEQLEDGTYWSVNLIALPYVISLSYIMLPANIIHSPNERLKYLIFSVWLVAIIINYGLIVRKRRWKRILERFDMCTTQKKEAFAAVTLITWAIILITLIFWFKIF
ncbi:hypothetical protein O71_10909 [Pontibacter sp. BAB1700]|nr:hypothetical protein O71_10909 [Pontibacter sp. BAB1700]